MSTEPSPSMHTTRRCGRATARPTASADDVAHLAEVGGARVLAGVVGPLEGDGADVGRHHQRVVGELGRQAAEPVVALERHRSLLPDAVAGDQHRSGMELGLGRVGGRG